MTTKKTKTTPQPFSFTKKSKKDMSKLISVNHIQFLERMEEIEHHRLSGKITQNDAWLLAILAGYEAENDKITYKRTLDLLLKKKTKGY